MLIKDPKQFISWAATSAKKLWDAVSIPQQLEGKQGRGGITPSANIAAGQNCPRDRPLFYTPTSPLFFISRHHPSWHPPAHPHPCNWEFRNINLNSTCREGKRFWYTVFASTAFDARKLFRRAIKILDRKSRGFWTRSYVMRVFVMSWLQKRIRI